MKNTLRLVFLGMLALLAAACATQASVTPTTAPAASAPTNEPTVVVPTVAPTIAEPTTEPAQAVAVAARPKFIDSYADW